MQDITLQALLEAGCYFGHKSERWNPRARQFIYTEKDGIHIIDLAKTKIGLERAAQFVRDLTAAGGEVLFVGTKRQAQGVVKEAAIAAGAPYFVERWIGGFLTNWDSIKKNIDKINRLTTEQENGGWKKFPKHEQVKLARYLTRLKVFYGGVLVLSQIPQALFVVDVRKEDAAVREGHRRELPIIGVVDTNTDPTGITYVIPANDDAVGSIQYIVGVIMQAYKEGKELREKEVAKEAKAKEIKKEEEKVEKSKRNKEKMNISLDLLKKLRTETDAGVSDCRQALEDADGNYEKAKKLLLERGLEKAAKKEGKETGEGIVASYVHTTGKVGVLVELRCETDFVARTDDFKKLAHELALQVAAVDPKSSEDLLKSPYIRNGGVTIESLIKSVIAKVGENITVGTFARIALT